MKSVSTKSDIFDESVTFEQMGLAEPVLRGLKEMGFEHPTHIQAQLIAPILAGHDVLGQAKTGTGKTAAFGLPILSKVQKGGGPQALVLAPTRELANQIVTELTKLGKYTGISPVSIVGGESSRAQVTGLSRGGQIVVGTPGRVMDLHGRGQLSYDRMRWVVLDEVDRMLDIGFRDDIRKILGHMRGEHQTVFVSATISEEIERLGRRHMKPDARKISTVADSLTVNQVIQKYVPVGQWDKDRMLHHLLTHEEPALTVVFCRTKRKVDKVADSLARRGIEAFAIHGDLPQGKRNRIMEQLRSGKLEVLVASDLASRGLDVQGITHIINYDLPDDPEVYVHRIGRTARAGRSGTAWSFVTPEQGQLLTEIEKLTNVHIEKLEYGDYKPRERPSDWKDEMPGGRRPGPDAPVAPPPKSRFETPAMPAAGDIDPAMFPGGVVPKSAPRKTLASKFRSGRGK